MYAIRMRGLERHAPPAYEPLTLAETKLYLRVDHSEDDLQIVTMIQAAREAAEQFLRRSLMTQQWRLTQDGLLAEETPLPMGPVSGVLAVEALDANGAAMAADPARYRLNAAADRLCFPGGLYADRVRVVYEAGYGAAEEVPATLRQGLLAHVAAMYDAGLAAAVMPEHCQRIYLPYRERRL